MTAGWAFRSVAFLLQLVPLALIAAYLFLLSKPPDNPRPGVASFMPPGLWYVFPYSILLGIVGIGALFSRTAAVAATIAAGGALAYGLRLLLPGVDPFLGSSLVGLAASRS